MRLHRAQTAHVMHMQAKNADRASMVPLWRAILYHPSLVDFVPLRDEFGGGGGENA